MDKCNKIKICMLNGGYVSHKVGNIELSKGDVIAINYDLEKRVVEVEYEGGGVKVYVGLPFIVFG